MEIYISDYQTVEKLVHKTQAKYVLSVGNQPECTDGLLDDLEYLHLQFADIDKPVPQNFKHAATKEQIQQIIDFAHRWNGDGPLIINCRQGHRRSPAAALIVMAAVSEHKNYEELLGLIREHAPHAEPNAWMIRIADYLLGAEDEMNRLLAIAYKAIKERPSFSYIVFE